MNGFLMTIAVILGLVVVAAMAPAMAYNLKDALLKLTRALPASTTAVTSASSIDTGKSTSMGVQVADVEYLLTAPAVTTAQLPDAKTFTYDIIHSDNADLSLPATLFTSVIIQTGAGGAGAAAAEWRGKLPSTAKRYIGFKVTPSGSGTGDASAASSTLEVVA